MKIILQKTFVNVIFIVALSLMVSGGLYAYQQIQRLINANNLVVHTHQVIDKLNSTFLYIILSEKQQQLYFKSNNPYYLANFQHAVITTKQNISDLKKLTENNPEQALKVEELDILTKNYLITEAEITQLFHTEGKDAAIQSTLTSTNQNSTDEVKNKIHAIKNSELSLLYERNTQALKGAMRSNVTLISVACLAVVLLMLSFVLLRLQLKERLRAEHRRKEAESQLNSIIQLQLTNEKLATGVKELEKRYQEISLLNDMTENLQSCLTAEEAYSPIKSFCQQVLPFSNGIVYFMHASHTYLELGLSWGNTTIKDFTFAPDDCWALRRNQTHIVENPALSVICGHAESSQGKTQSYVCIPLMAHNETLGLLYLELSADQTTHADHDLLNEHQRLLLVTTAEHISLALANIRLRETLRFLSVRDPLTGLYNRRYLEETLTREFQRAERNRVNVAMVMIDVDHFKRFNDTYGHDAGDYVLKNIAKLFQDLTRGSDVVCRFGGEEFLIVLYDTSYPTAIKYAENLRRAVTQMDLHYNDKTLGAISISIGLSVFPDDGIKSQSLIEAADHALYRAKKEGRNRVVTVSEESFS